MANEQQLGEFVTNLLDDLQSGAITAEEAIIASSQYEYIRSLFSQHAQDLADATATGDEALKNSLISIFSQTKGRLAELPAFSSQTPDILREEKQTRDTATLEHAAFETIRKETKTKASSRKQARREFIHALVNQYSSRANNSPISEAKMDSLVDSVLADASKEQSSQGAKQHFIKDLAQKFGTSDSAFEKTLGSLVSKDATNTVAGSWKDVQAEKEALVTLFAHSDLSRPDVVADVFVHASDKENLSGLSAHATKLAQTAGAISALGTKQPTIKGSFFSNSNTNGLIKGLQQAADGMLSLVGEPLREIIIKEKISGAIRSVLTNTSQMADKLGEQFVQSPIFGFISQNVLKATNEKPSMSQSTAVFSDVFSSIFRGPLNIATTRGAQGHVYDYFTLARASSNAPKGFSFLSTNIMPWHLGSLHAEYLLSTKKGSVGRGGWFPSFGLHALQSLSSLAGNTLSTIFDRFVGFVFTGSSLSRQIHASRRAATIPLPLSEDLPLLLSIVIVGTIIILYVFPTFLNIPHLSMTQKMSALLASLNDGKGGVDNEPRSPNVAATTFTCSWSGPNPPPSPISVCPARAPISQGPFSASGSHKNLNAYDLAAPQGTSVLAAHGGYVVSYYNAYAPNQFVDKSYGNNVVLIGTNPATGKTFCTNYAHLLGVSPLVVSNAGKPIFVPAGEILGYVDTTGYTYGYAGKGTGTHLHFGYNQSGPFLPPGCP